MNIPLASTTLALFLALNGTAQAADLVVAQVAQMQDPASVGAQMQRGATIYFDSVNRAGGVHGKTLRLVSRHRGPEAAEAVLKIREVLSEVKPIALLNLMGTGAMEALVKARVLDQEAIPVIGIRAGSTSLHMPVHPWLFHTRASYAVEVDKVVRHFATIGIKRIALIHETSPFGKEIERLAEASVASVGMTLVSRATIDPATRDVTAACKSTVAAGPEAVLLAAPSPDTADVYKRLRGNGLSVHVIALSTTDGAVVAKRIGNHLAHGLGITQVVPDPASRTTQISREFQRELQKVKAPVSDMNQGVLEGYIAAKVLVEALRRAGPEPTRVRLRQALEGLSSYDLGGLPISMSSSNHSGSSFVDIAVMNRHGRMLR